MNTRVAGLELRRPRSVDDALRLLRDEPGLTPIAGATDLYVALNFGTLTSSRFIDLWALEALRTIEMRGDTLVIGALASYSAIMRSPLVQRRLPILAQAAGQIGGVQIQNRGTLGGNIANGSPAGDSLPVLAVADALVALRDADGERHVPLTQYYTGYRAAVRRPDELIVAVEIPPMPERQWFRKVGTRAAQAISKVVMAAVRAPQPRLALGSVAATVVRLPRTELALAQGAAMDDAVAVLVDEIQPIDDVRSTAAYRRAVSANLLRRFWAETA